MAKSAIKTYRADYNNLYRACYEIIDDHPQCLRIVDDDFEHGFIVAEGIRWVDRTILTVKISKSGKVSAKVSGFLTEGSVLNTFFENLEFYLHNRG